MIDIESDVFAEVSKSVREVYPKIYFVGEYVRTPPTFPAAYLVEMDNRVYTDSQDTSNTENHDFLMYEANVFSNKSKGKKAECKAIMALIDNKMLSLGFSRTMLQPVPNMDDATISRMTARYTAVVDKNKVIYRR